MRFGGYLTEIISEMFFYDANSVCGALHLVDAVY